MKMIPTGGAAPIGHYSQYIHNCLRDPQCAPSYAVPIPGIPYIQLYVDYGNYQPATFEIHLLDLCNVWHTEQIFPANYVIGQHPEGGYYGVFKFFKSPLTSFTRFVVWLSSMVDVGGALVERTFFSQEFVTGECMPLMKITACHPEGSTTTGFDLNGIYYGLPDNDAPLGMPDVRYFHVAWVRQGKVRELSNKATFTASFTKNFRTEIERIWQLETEIVPQWYKDVLFAIYSRGAVKINGTSYLLSELAFEALHDNDTQWKPWVQLKQTQRLYYGCDESVCADCCSPRVISAEVFEGFGPETYYIVDDGGNIMADGNDEFVYYP